MKSKMLLIWGIGILLVGIVLLYSSVSMFIRVNSPIIQDQMRADTETSLRNMMKELEDKTGTSFQHKPGQDTLDLTANLYITSTKNMSIRIFFFALICILSGIGILVHKNWARLLFLSFMIFLLIYHMYQPLLAITKKVEIVFTLDVTIFHILYVLSLLLIIFYLTRPKVKSYFQSENKA